MRCYYHNVLILLPQFSIKLWGVQVAGYHCVVLLRSY